MESNQVSAIVSDVQGLSDAALVTIGTVDPGVRSETAAAAALVDVLAVLVGHALVAYSAAAGVPITAETVLALMPDMTPLPLPVVALPRPVASVPVGPVAPMMYGPEVWAGAPPVVVETIPQPGPGLASLYKE